MGKTEYLITIIVFNLFFVLFMAAIVIYIRQYRIKKKEHNTLLDTQKSEHQKEILATQIEIQLQTMQHIGREIHDNIGQKLTLASLYTQQLAYQNKVPQVNDKIETIGQIIDDSLSELRQLSKSLTDNSIDKECLQKLLQAECDKIDALRKCQVSFTSKLTQMPLSYQKKSVLLRVSQEFLQNSIKHSDCEKIVLQLDHFGENLRLRLYDDGCGFNVENIATSGIGLANMKKRIQIIGGTFIMESNVNGTLLEIQIPIK